MDALDLAERAIALIKTGAANRDVSIGAALGEDFQDVAAALVPACVSGELVSCRVSAPNALPINEYRISASLPKFNFRTLTTKEHAEHKARVKEIRAAIAKGEPIVETKPSAPVAREPQGEPQMKLKDRIIEALTKRGPLSADALAGQCGSTRGLILFTVAKMKAAGDVTATGSPRSRVYVLPGDTRVASAASTASVSKPKKAAKLQRKTAKRKAKTPRIASVLKDKGVALGKFHPYAGSFRPAVASDGALLLMGASQPGELNRAEFSALVGFIRKMDDGGMFAE
jgi:hypothetical protein